MILGIIGGAASIVTHGHGCADCDYGIWVVAAPFIMILVVLTIVALGGKKDKTKDS